MRERATGYDAWRKAGVDSMVVVPRASTHLDYTDIPLVLPASRYGQDLSSHYVQAWLDRYLKHQSNDAALTGSTLPLPRARRQRRLEAGDPPARLPAELLLLLGLRLPLRPHGSSRTATWRTWAAARRPAERSQLELTRLLLVSRPQTRENRAWPASRGPPSPPGAEFFLDTRGDARSLRVRWHHEDGLVLLSLWRGGECTGTFRLAGRGGAHADRRPARRPGRGVRGHPALTATTR